jgi:hypothetical protein
VSATRIDQPQDNVACAVLERPQSEQLTRKIKLEEAVASIRKHLAELRVSLEDPLAPISDNAIEQMVKREVCRPIELAVQRNSQSRPARGTADNADEQRFPQ